MMVLYLVTQIIAAILCWIEFLPVLQTYEINYSDKELINHITEQYFLQCLKYMGVKAISEYSKGLFFKIIQNCICMKNFFPNFDPNIIIVSFLSYF